MTTAEPDVGTVDSCDYADALNVKRNHVSLFLMELSGAFSPPAYRHLRWLQARSRQRDTTPYTGWAAGARASARPFMTHWAQRISTAVVCGNSRRGLNAVRALGVRLSFTT